MSLIESTALITCMISAPMLPPMAKSQQWRQQAHHPLDVSLQLRLRSRSPPAAASDRPAGLLAHRDHPQRRRRQQPGIFKRPVQRRAFRHPLD